MMPDLASPSVTAPRPTFDATCNAAAAELRRIAQDAYDRGDQSTGDRCTTRALAWELARDAGDLTLLERRP